MISNMRNTERGHIMGYQYRVQAATGKYMQGLDFFVSISIPPYISMMEFGMSLETSKSCINQLYQPNLQPRPDRLDVYKF